MLSLNKNSWLKGRQKCLENAKTTKTLRKIGHFPHLLLAWHTNILCILYNQYRLLVFFNFSIVSVVFKVFLILSSIGGVSFSSVKYGKSYGKRKWWAREGKSKSCGWIWQMKCFSILQMWGVGALLLLMFLTIYL